MTLPVEIFFANAPGPQVTQGDIVPKEKEKEEVKIPQKQKKAKEKKKSRQEKAKETRFESLAKSLMKIFFSSHPNVEQRIARVRTLYGTSANGDLKLKE